MISANGTHTKNIVLGNLFQLMIVFNIYPAEKMPGPYKKIRIKTGAYTFNQLDSLLIIVITYQSHYTNKLLLHNQ